MKVGIRDFPFVKLGFRDFPYMKLGIRDFPYLRLGIRDFPCMKLGIRDFSYLKLGIRDFPYMKLGIREFPHLKLGIRDFKAKSGRVSGLDLRCDAKSPSGLRDCTKFWVGITGLKNPVVEYPDFVNTCNGVACTLSPLKYWGESC